VGARGVSGVRVDGSCGGEGGGVGSVRCDTPAGQFVAAVSARYGWSGGAAGMGREEWDGCSNSDTSDGADGDEV
jgi:hypothetical protein